MYSFKVKLKGTTYYGVGPHRKSIHKFNLNVNFNWRQLF